MTNFRVWNSQYTRLGYKQSRARCDVDRLDRIYRLHHLLDGRRTPVPFERIQEELDCHPRTVYRAINDLRDYLGAPIVSVREQGYLYDKQSDRPYELPGLWFSADELQALLILYRHVERLEPSFLYDQLAPLRQRLDRLLTDRRLGAAGLADRVRFLSIGGRRGTPRHFARVAEALLQRRAVQIRYIARSTETATERTVDPQRLVRYRDAWYLDAWCRLREDLRMFSLDRIEHCRDAGEPARDIAEDRMDAHYASAYGIFAGEATDTALLRFTPMGARWAAAAEWHPAQEECWLDDGRYELRVPYNRAEELVRDVLAYGPDAEIVEPAALREQVERRLRDTVAVYGVGQGGD